MDNYTHEPQQIVFAIPELVENILSQANLPPLALLGARLINRTTNLVVLSAQPLRRALFLSVTLDKRNSTFSIEINPLLEKLFPPFMQTHFARLRRRRDAEAALALGYFGGAEAGRVTDMAYADAALLPTIVEAERCKGMEFKWACLGSSYEGPCLHLPFIGKYEDDLREVEGGLWRRMYATKPAVPVHVVELSACGGLEHLWEFEAGTRMGEVMDGLTLGRRGKREDSI